MISAKAIEDRSQWADEMTEEETAQKLAVLLENELGFDVDPEKLPDALRRAVHRLRIEAWRGACFAFMGADRAEAGR